MKRIIKLELKRARKIYEPKLIISLAVILVVLLGFFFVVLKTGGKYHNIYYKYYSEDSFLDDVLKQSDKFKRSENYDLYVLSGINIYLMPNGYKGSPAKQSAYEFFKDYNYFIIDEYNISPSLYIDIVSHNVSRKTGLTGGKNIKENNLNTLTNLSKSIEEKKTTKEKKNNPPIIELDEGLNDKSGSETIKKTEEKKIKQRLDNKRYLTPRDIEPRMPFDEIYLAMSFIIFLTFISLMYTNRVMDEKTNKKSILLFVAPIRKYKIVVGKLIPYLVLSYVLSLILWTIHTKNNFISYSLLSLSIIMSYLAISYFIGIVARSFKELSFLGIFGISMYSLFLLIPVFLMNFSPASYASPLTPLIKIITNQAISYSELIFSIIPHLLFAFILFSIGYYLFNPEDMFNYKRLYEKVLDFYRIYLKRKINYFFSGFFALFFIYLIELLLIVTFVTMNKNILLISILATSAIVEETIRNLPMYVSNFRRIKDIAIYSFLVGFGFFVAEKFLLLISIAPFTKTLTILQFSTLFFPFIMHIILTFLFSLSYKYTRNYIFSILLSSIIHFMVNYYLFRLI